MMAQTTRYFHRHPELVSGSIGREILNFDPQNRVADWLPNSASACGEKWTLKQVQGDEGELG
jgi:hypothetical protein